MASFGLIFDFDGVIADSEVLANVVFAEHVSRLGLPMTLEDALTLYVGKGWREVAADLEGRLGKSLPENFIADLKVKTAEAMRKDLREVVGATMFIRHFAEVPRCIASSSPLNYLRLCLDTLGLSAEFGDHVYSADMVARGKPHPDIFLFAADQIRVAPADCIVIEDSVSGVRASLSAGMTTIGLCAGSHSRPGHARRLVDAGAIQTAETWNDALKIVSSLRAENTG